MAQKRKTLNENEIRTVLAVFKEIERLPYSELNKMLGSITIEEMVKLCTKLNDWYQPNVMGKVWDEDMGWTDRNADY